VILGLANYISVTGFALIVATVGGSMLLVGWLASRFVPGAPRTSSSRSRRCASRASATSR